MLLYVNKIIQQAAKIIFKKPAEFKMPFWAPPTAHTPTHFLIRVQAITTSFWLFAHGQANGLDMGNSLRYYRPSYRNQI